MIRRTQPSRVRGLAAVGTALLVLTGSAVVIAQPAEQAPAQPAQRQPGERPQRGPGGPGGAARDFNSVEAGMKGLRQGMRQIRDLVADPAKKEEALQMIGLMQRAAVAAKGNKPEHMKEGVSIDDFRREMIKLVTQLLELETAVLDGKTEEAAALVTKLGEFRDASHEKFGEGKD
ncbi:MAG TPA: cytochrome b562 [Phycisphaerales bacterium]|nr:cytochrome b562 [Phycisphaerales bacterium]